MHTKSCTTANSARAAVKEIISNQLKEIGQSIREREQKLHQRYRGEMGLDALEKKRAQLREEANRIEKEIAARVASEIKQHERSIVKHRDKLCSMRAEVLFAKTARIREMYEELSK